MHLRSRSCVSNEYVGFIRSGVDYHALVNLYAYQPDFIAAYCRLSVFFEHFIMVSFPTTTVAEKRRLQVMQYEQRQCLLENDAKVYAEQLEKLQEYQQKLDEIWRSSRWISNIASDARHRQQNCSIPLDRILVMPLQRPSDDPEDWRHVRKCLP